MADSLAAMKPPPAVLTIAGSDPTGGAGIQADLRTFEACGVHGASAVTALTVQDSRGVAAIHPTKPAIVVSQMEAALQDLKIRGVKSGMLATPAIARAVASTLRRHGLSRYVCDPVLAASAGGALAKPGLALAIRRHLLPLAAVVTPNVPEAEVLTGLRVRTIQEAIEAARDLRQQGARAVLLKGGHLEAAPATDILLLGNRVILLEGTFFQDREVHGTGCVYASAIASYLAGGSSLIGAVRRAKRLVSEAIRNARPAGKRWVADPAPTRRSRVSIECD